MVTQQQLDAEADAFPEELSALPDATSDVFTTVEQPEDADAQQSAADRSGGSR